MRKDGFWISNSSVIFEEDEELSLAVEMASSFLICLSLACSRS